MILNEDSMKNVFYGLINFILKYCKTFEDLPDQLIEDLLHETILMIGYYTVMNEVG